MHPANYRMQERIQDLRAKPEHVRQNIALAVSGGFTLLVIVGWIGALAHDNTFALNRPSDNTGVLAEPSKQIAETQTNFSQLVGAAGAAFGATTSPSAVTIVDSAPKEEVRNAPEQTVIHF